MPGLLTIGEPQFGQQREENVLDTVRQAMGGIALGAGGIGLLAPRIGIASGMAQAAPSTAADLLFSQYGRSLWPFLGMLGGLTGVGTYGASKVADMIKERNAAIQKILDEAK